MKRSSLKQGQQQMLLAMTKSESLHKELSWSNFPLKIQNKILVQRNLVTVLLNRIRIGISAVNSISIYNIERQFWSSQVYLAIPILLFTVMLSLPYQIIFSTFRGLFL